MDPRDALISLLMEAYLAGHEEDELNYSQWADEYLAKFPPGVANTITGSVNGTVVATGHIDGGVQFG